MKFILRIILLAAVIFFMPRLIPGFSVESWQAALAFTAVLTIVNFTIKPVLSFLTFPLNALTLGALGLVVNGALFMLAGHFVSGIEIAGFVTAFVCALAVSLVHFIVSRF